MTDSTPGNRRHEKHRSQRDVLPLEQRERDERPDDGARVIRRSMKPERLPTNRRIHRLGDQGVARRTANSLPHAIRETNREHLRRRLCDRDERARERRERVPRDDERLTPTRRDRTTSRSRA